MNCFNLRQIEEKVENVKQICGVRRKERQRQTETETYRERETATEIDRPVDKGRDRQTFRQANRQKQGRYINTVKDGEREREIVRQ